ncbi:RNA polymerase sigma factor [Streptomyces sp. BK340]|uniref:RNA polymerase sigma factor n=1 Tax=Streptomyces sp. BK340 TaxID=2572903 RepID=UPI0021BD1D88|nr:sigma-70 family RNA polymerase sigma factor [Streptomyces sp. BK340]
MDTFTDVYRAQYEDGLRFVRRRAHPMNVDDIVGETFLAAWRRRGGLPEDPRPWLFGTARNATLDAHRGHRRQTAVAVRVMENGGEDSYDGLAQGEERMDLVTAWRRLSAADREVPALHVREGLTDRDAASETTLNVSEPPTSRRRSPSARPWASRSRTTTQRGPRPLGRGPRFRIAIRSAGVRGGT